ncbi:helix-turn-helix domain-containing protein [Hymenobacter taeanensis]|uniref:Helix-turn-helix domain-containing protein n=1 Tax=Hymenobacter taeanensis TaxID=2735321 RepID=A0A6M6BI38_9BACT|nr:helix-turn-helix domain-containing protein [Hymenobacter taeanensis]QJX47807.1 helix-turn-helix domain-containing protein [Hymenobacter taeanensis]
MQVALLVPEQEWRQLLSDVQRLKETEAAPKMLPAPSAPPDRILTVREAAHYMRLKPEGVRNARRAGRLQGLRLNEKEWGFHLSELNRYLSRYNRRPLDFPSGS